jgi:hypothetical protein
MCGASFFMFLFYQPNWSNWGQLEMQKGQMIEDKAGARCAGCSDEDAQQRRCFFYFSLLSFFSLSLFF